MTSKVKRQRIVAKDDDILALIPVLQLFRIHPLETMYTVNTDAFNVRIGQ